MFNSQVGCMKCTSQENIEDSLNRTSWFLEVKIWPVVTLNLQFRIF